MELLSSKTTIESRYSCIGLLRGVSTQCSSNGFFVISTQPHIMRYVGGDECITLQHEQAKAGSVGET